MLTGCLDREPSNDGQDGGTDPDEALEEVDSENQEEPGKDEVDKEKIDNPETVADMIVSAMEEKDIETLANFVHPSKGVRFSPYGYINVDEHLVFTAEELNELLENDTVHQWGSFDGTGDPIEMTFTEYYQRFVYDEDYLNAEIRSVDERLGQGNTIDNLADVYPDTTVVEYHFSGFDPQYDGMDWRSLRIVLEKEAGQWYLVAIIHDEWTI